MREINDVEILQTKNAELKRLKLINASLSIALLVAVGVLVFVLIAL